MATGHLCDDTIPVNVADDTDQEAPVSANPYKFPQYATCAVLVDGENISYRVADQILQYSANIGEPLVRRVYGNACVIGEWESQPGFNFVHTGCGKNSADMKLAIDAVELSHSERIDGFVIVTSDGDFAHLANALRERGSNVFGLGEVKAPEKFRKACTSFQCLSVAKNPAEEGALPDLTKIKAGGLTDKLIQEIRQEGSVGLEIASLNAVFRRRFGTKFSDYAEKTWRGYLTRRTDVFDCDPKGPGSCVRLKIPVPAVD